MACVALASLIATIKLQFLQSMPRVSLHDHAPIKSLNEKVSSLRAFLQKQSGGGGGTAIKDLEVKIRDFALKAEDDIEIQLSNFLLAKDQQCRENASQKLHQTLQEAAGKATELLKMIHNTSSDVHEDSETQPSFRRSKRGSKPAENVKMVSPKPAEVKMVGRRHDCSVIKDQIFRSKDDLLLIAIVGMKGIGKTTLARSVYRDASVARSFHLRRWITMPQECNRSQMLRRLLQSISPIDAYQIKKRSSPEKLAAQVRRCLIGNTYLIVLDNMLNNQAWDDIKECFPVEDTNSCILLTTTHFQRSSYYSRSRCYMHTMILLDENESWGLFCNLLSPNKECMSPKFEEIRSEVLEICDGLPLSVVAVAKHLSKCNNIQQEWEKIKKRIESLGILDRYALTINYNQLSQELKVCFLYLGVFPKRSGILVKTLIRLWSAEGFLKQLEHQEAETLAYQYLQELIDRSLVLICNPGSDGKIKTCRMHSAIHSFCVVEAQKEGIFCAVNTQEHPRVSLNMFANSGRWLSLYKHSFDYYVLFSTNKPRSVFFFHENPKTFIPFKLLRVLAFVPSPFLQSLSMHSGDLVFLRYLSVAQWFDSLNDIVSINPNLRTLIISGNKSHLGAPTLLLPSKVWELPQLRHLELGNMYAIDPPSEVKENLLTLSWVSPTHCRKEVVYNSFPNLRKLKVFYKDDVELNHTDGSCINPIIFYNLDYLEELEKLTISVSASCIVTLPERSVFPLQLKKLKLNGTNLSERDLIAIGTLPLLEVFKLQNAFHGKVWKIANRGFSSLRLLLLEAENLEQLVAKKHSFSKMRRLVLRFCNCLKRIPGRFRYIPSLQSIELEQCCPSVIISAKKIQEGLPPSQKEMFEIKTKGSKYDESQHTHTEESDEDESDEDDSDDSMEDDWDESPEDDLEESDQYDSVEEQLRYRNKST